MNFFKLRNEYVKVGKEVGLNRYRFNRYRCYIIVFNENNNYSR